MGLSYGLGSKTQIKKLSEPIIVKSPNGEAFGMEQFLLAEDNTFSPDQSAIISLAEAKYINKDQPVARVLQ